MRSRLALSTAICLLLMMAGSAGAAPFVPKMQDPKSYKDFIFGLTETRANIEGVQCGGWADGTAATVSGTGIDGAVPMPDVSPDVPGRGNQDPLGAPITGLGERGQFDYPDSAFGFLSACNVFAPRMHDRDLERVELDIVYDNITDPGEDPNPRVQPGTGEIDINPYKWCIIPEKATPRWCEKLYDTWRRMAEIAPRPPADSFCQCPPNSLCAPAPQGPEKHYCFDYAGAAPTAADYTKECNGQECRTPWEPEFANALVQCGWESTEDGLIPVNIQEGIDIGKQSSFYRHYGNRFEDWSETRDKNQTPLTVRTPGFEWKLRVDCYHYYREDDPKDIVTGKEQEQCEIVILSEDEQDPEPPEWQPPELQKGRVKADLTEEPRETRLVPEPWVADPETNLSIIDMGKLREDQEGAEDPTDIHGVLGAILPARQRASDTVPKNARTDMMDDTAERDVSIFWEAQQRELLKMIADPKTRLIMPARFLVGLADDDPIYQYVSHTVSRSDGTVELTLKAGLEDVGNVITSFQRIFVAPLQEVRIPVVVPLASLSEIDARIFEWKQWQQLEDTSAADAVPPRTSLASEADAHIAILESYRERVLRVRALRGALITYLTKLYEPQRQIREYFADWYEKNTEVFLETTKRAVQRRELQRIWKLTQQSMLQIDACQLLWCSNQRYSAPVYSLLDEWWGEAQPGSQRDPGYHPPDLRDLGYVQPEDQLFDFSDVKFPREPWLVPVLWPVHARVRLPQPPALAGMQPQDPADYPPLPEVPSADIFEDFPVPSVDLPEKTFITPTPSSDLEPAKRMLRDIRYIIDGTDPAQQMQQEEALASGAPIDVALNFPMGRDNGMRGAYCRFPPSAILPPDEEQKEGNSAKIIHVENDMKERIARLFSRWMPARAEDFAGRVARRNADFPDAEAPPACHEDVLCYFLPPEKQTVTTWQWFMADSASGNFDTKAAEIRNDTLPGNDDENPYFYASTEVLRRIFPALDLPIRTHLSPDE